MGSRSVQRREAILDAALHCYTEGGAAAVTIHAVGQRSGASVGSIYHHFGNKDGILRALFHALLTLYRAHLLAYLEAVTGAEATIKAMVAQHLRWIGDHPNKARFLFSMRHNPVLASDEEVLREETTQFVNTFRARMRGWVERGELRPIPLGLAVPIIMGPAHQLGRHWLSGRLELDLEAAAVELGAAAWRAVRAEPVPPSPEPVW
ncbi:MAG: TetR/AcrR family transcriptional regulator [Myxococcota bacterium]